MKTIKPFLFKNLPTFTKDEVRLLNAFCRYVSLTNLKDKFPKDISTLLEEYLKGKVEVEIGGIKKSTFRDYKISLPDFPVVCIIGFYPIDRKAILEIDTQLTNVIINKLLGKSEDTYIIRKRLTEIEEAILEYILLKILAIFHQNMNNLEIRLEKISNSTEELVLDDEDILSLMMNISIDNKRYFIRLVLPAGLINEALIQPFKDKNLLDNIFKTKLWWLSNIGLDIKAQIGKVDISQEDILGLEVGDIILLDKSSVQFSKEGLKGEVSFQIGQSKIDRVKAEILSDEKEILRVKITQT